MREGDERDQAEAEPETPGHAQRTAVLCDDARPATVTVPGESRRGPRPWPVACRLLAACYYVQTPQVEAGLAGEPDVAR